MVICKFMEGLNFVISHQTVIFLLFGNSIFTFTFMHLADAFIQSDLQCIQAILFVLSVHVFPGNRTHNLCAAFFLHLYYFKCIYLFIYLLFHSFIHSFIQVFIIDREINECQRSLFL